MYEFHALEKEKELKEKERVAKRKEFYEKINAIENLTECEKDLLLRICLCEDESELFNLKYEYEEHYNALIEKGYIEEKEVRFYNDTKSE